jgi:hypothetical protein
MKKVILSIFVISLLLFVVIAQASWTSDMEDAYTPEAFKHLTTSMTKADVIKVVGDPAYIENRGEKVEELYYAIDLNSKDRMVVIIKDGKYSAKRAMPMGQSPR